MLTKLIIFAVLAIVAWRLWQSAIVKRGPPPPPGGFTPNPEQLVRCDRCGVRVPASEISAIRANCRQCANGG
ncbi:MAG: hypothetical protein V4650_13645 [Pseudomonadota bacterium]